MKFLPPCPQGLDHRCRLHAAVVDLSLGSRCSIEWRWAQADEVNALLGVYGVVPSDACACALANARMQVLDLLERKVEGPQPDVLAAVRTFVCHGLGRDCRVVVEVEAPARPTWLP